MRKDGDIDIAVNGKAWGVASKIQIPMVRVAIGDDTFYILPCMHCN